MAQYIPQVSYGLTSPLEVQAPFPIHAQRAPTPGDIGYVVGQSWVDIPANAVYILTSVVANQANWLSLAAAGMFDTITTTGQFQLDTVAVAANTLGNLNGATSIQASAGTGGIRIQTLNGPIDLTTGTGAINIGADATVKTITIGNVAGATGVVIDAGANGITLASGNGTIALTSGLGAINIGTDGNQKVITLGNATAASSVVVNVGTGNANFGANATDHSTNVGSITGVSQTTIFGGTSGIFLSADYVALPGGPRIYTGAGVPAGALANAIGTIYINTTAASAVTRMYIASAIGTFTNVTCAA